jgi:hypothetical protein
MLKQQFIFFKFSRTLNGFVAAGFSLRLAADPIRLACFLPIQAQEV